MNFRLLLLEIFRPPPKIMDNLILQKFTVEKSLIFIMLGAIVIVAIIVIFLFFSYGAKSIQVLAPNGSEKLEIGKSSEISWKAKGLNKVGIVLFHGTEAQWLAKDLKASSGKYNWEILPGQTYGSDYWIAVFEYPWQKGNKIDYSDNSFSITFSELTNCETLSIKNEWPYLASDFPNLRRVFLTQGTYNGNLDGLEGADKKCQEEAEKQGLSGQWQAFIGADSDQETALVRISQTPRTTSGIFIWALPEGEPLIRGVACHRLLAKDFEEFSKRIYSLGNLWLGRLDEKSKKNCLAIEKDFSNPYIALAEKYSFTSTCQSWTTESNLVEGYPAPKGKPSPSFPTCYTPQGKFTEAVASAGLASVSEGSVGKSCNTQQNLLCIEE